MSKNLNISAGKRALALIRDNGLAPDMVQVVAGAAGGPKWLILYHLDRFLFSSWIIPRISPLYLIGSSIGAWRFAALSQKDPAGALEKFLCAYLGQTYNSKPTPREVTEETIRIMDAFLDDNGIQEILNHSFLRLNLLAVYCRRLASVDAKAVLGPSIAISALLNMIDRRLLKCLFRRTLFYNPQSEPPFWNMNHFPPVKTPLNKNNLRSALLATGSIPLVMSRVKNIHGAPAGVYRDGGVIDYHLDIDFTRNKDKIVLYPHYTDRIVPGWFDKKLASRKPGADRMAPVLMVSPSESFVSKLPLGKISDRNDFWLFKGKDKERVEYWKNVVDMGRHLAEDFAESLESGRIRKLVRPMECR